MTDPKLPRPRQVTTSAVMIMVGSVAVVLTVFGQVSGLESLESRRRIEETLGTSPVDTLGFSVASAQTALRIAALVSAACATAAAILGYQVLQRSRSARVALSVLALPLFMTGIVGGGILSSVVVAASLLLWAQPARDWFDGVAAAPASPASRRAERESDRLEGRDPDRREAQRAAFAPPSQQSTQQQPGVPAAQVGSPEGRSEPPAYGAAYASPGSTVSHRPAPGAPPGPRPPAVLWACVLTWAFTGLAAVLMALVALALVAVPDLYDEVSRQTPELAEQGITESQVVTTAVVTAVVVVVWSALAALFAVQTWRRRGWARIALLVSAALAGLLSLTGVVASVVLLVPLAACVAVLVLLLRPESRWWVG